jgi:AcrR family transcriptional regulator
MLEANDGRLKETMMPKGVPLTEDEVSRRRHEILDVALRLFAERGFNETSMRAIGEAAGAGKSTIYDYFPSKDEILIFFVVDEVRQLTAQATQVIAMDLTCAEKIRRIMRNQLDFTVANRSLYLRLAFESQRLSLESQQRIQLQRHSYQDMVCDLVRQGVQTGEFRPVNPLLAVRGMFALLTAATITSRPTGSPEEMLAEACDLIFKGLEAR